MVSVYVASAMLIISNALLLGVAAVACRRFVQRKQDEIVATVTEELRKLVAHEPCSTGAVLNEVGRMIGAQAGTSAKAALMADLSHASREANTLKTQAQIDAIGAQQPALGNLLSSVGTKKAKGLLGNPLVQMLAQAFLGGGSPGDGNGASASEYTGRIHRD